MSVAGRKPKPEGERRNRHAPTHDWSEVPNIPYAGSVPKLATRRRTDPDTGLSMPASWPAATKRWWETVSRMPHCKLWTESDWQFAMDTAEIHARFVEGANGTELRIREKLLGTTLDARRDLRVRYTEPKPEQSVPAGVARLDDYRDL